MKLRYAIPFALSVFILPQAETGGASSFPTQKTAPPTIQQTLDAFKVITLSPDLLCMAAVIFGESRGEPLEGQIAVAFTLRNRSVASGETYCTESHKPHQFYVSNYRLRTPAWDTAETIAFLVGTGRVSDPVGGATFFHSGSKPYWTTTLKQTRKIGGHSFYGHD